MQFRVNNYIVTKLVGLIPRHVHVVKNTLRIMESERSGTRSCRLTCDAEARLSRVGEA